jgi:uncharacterized membrane protein YwaF
VIASAHLGAGLVAGMAASRASGGWARRIVIALALGLASHVMLDAIPHADYGFLRRLYILPIALCEAAVLFGVAALILRRRVVKGWQYFLAAGIFASAVPDARFGLEMFPWQIKYKVLFATYWFHSFFHAGPVTFWIGMVNQVVVALLCVAALFAFPRTDREASAAGRE